MTNKIFPQGIYTCALYSAYFVLVSINVAFKVSDDGGKSQLPLIMKLVVPGKTQAHIFVQPKYRQLRLGEDTIPFSFAVRDSNNNERNVVSGKYWDDENGMAFSFSDTLLLNYKKWSVAAGNRMLYTLRGIRVSNLVLKNDSAIISVNNRDEILNSPVDIAISNLDVADLTAIFKKDTLTAAGLLNAKLQVGLFNKLLPAITGSASITGLKWMQQAVGNLQVNMQQVDDTSVNTSLGLSENGNDVNVEGRYFLNNAKQQFDALVDIKKLQAWVWAALLKGKVNNAFGNINGLVHFNGKLKAPQWYGQLNFDSTRFSVPQSGNTYSINRQKLLLQYPNVNFNGFTVKDSLGHPLVIDGKLCADNLKKMELELDVKSSGFALLNAPKVVNNQMYGYAGVDANVSIWGLVSRPLVTGDIYLDEKSDITLVVPEKNIDKDASGSVVRFVNRDSFALPSRGMLQPAAESDTGILKYINQQLNIHINKQAALTIVMDPTNGDELKLRGAGVMKAGIDPGGNMLLDGAYILDSGYYELNYQFSKKRFNVVKGSVINFAGKPTVANIDINAGYIASTAPKDLLGNEVGDVSPAMARSFNKKIPFKVLLSLKGSLNRPSVNFDIEMQDSDTVNKELRYIITNKLRQLNTDVAATNRQVFALLVLDRFVGEQSADFFKGNGGGLGGVSGESVSKFLAAALDEIASDLFKGINADLNLNSFKDFTAARGTSQTDLNIEVSKNFLNDRLSVTVGKNFGIESQDGSAKAAKQKGSRFLPDVTVDYKLSANGKYMLRSYNKDPFQVILDGYVIETGLAFIVTVDYDLLQELFLKNRQSPGQQP